MSLRPWLRPGIGVKRWILLAFVGLVLLALAGAFALRAFYRDVEVGGPLQSIVSLVTLQFLPYAARGAILVVAGGAIFAFAAWRLLAVLVGPFLAGDRDQPLVEVIYQKRFLARGPRVVAIGGGTGLSTLLRGLKEHTSATSPRSSASRTTAAPREGSASGWACRPSATSATASSRSRTRSRSWATCSSTGSARRTGRLAGHPVGNLLLAAMYELDGGDFAESVRRMNRVLAVRGQGRAGLHDAGGPPRHAVRRDRGARRVVDPEHPLDRARLALAGRHRSVARRAPRRSPRRT